MVTYTNITDGYIAHEAFDSLGFSQVAAAGPIVAIAGTAALRSASGGFEVVCPDDQRGQLAFVLEVIERSLAAAGVTKADLIALNMFTTDIAEFMKHMDVVVEWLDGSRPTSTTVEVTNLVDPGMLLEINATAVR